MQIPNDVLLLVGVLLLLIVFFVFINPRYFRRWYMLSDYAATVSLAASTSFCAFALLAGYQFTPVGAVIVLLVETACGLVLMYEADFHERVMAFCLALVSGAMLAILFLQPRSFPYLVVPYITALELVGTAILYYFQFTRSTEPIASIPDVTAAKAVPFKPRDGEGPVYPPPGPNKSRKIKN